MEMESLKDYEWEMSYRTSGVNSKGKPVDILHDFYLPALERIVSYDRVAGYFRSTSLAAASQGFTKFLQHDGHMRLIVGADLALEDVAAIIKGDAQRMAEKLEKALEQEESWPEDVKNGVALLSEMVAREKLEVRVAFRVSSVTGKPVAVDSCEDGYVHEKWFVMQDADGNRISGGGSLNESKTALTLNAENVDVFCEWEGSKFHQRVEQDVKAFDELWNNVNPHMKVYPLPKAVKEKLVKLKNLRNKPTEIDWTVIDDEEQEMSPEELLKFAVLMDAPKMPGGVFVGMYSAPVKPWPHQEIVARRLVETYPYSYMMCDEVGLGKTIEAALAIRSLILSGRAKRVLIIAPAGLTSQWHRELAEKAMLSFARSWNKPGTGNYIVSDFLYPKEEEKKHLNLFTENFNIVSSGIAQREGRQKQFVSAEPFDIVLLDEAHYARRKNPNAHDAGNAEYGNLYKMISRKVVKHTNSLWLATATPMQLDAVEAYDLLRLTRRSGPFMDDPGVCLEYYAVLGKLIDDKKSREISQQEWSFVGQSFVQLESLDGYLWDFLQNTVVDGRNNKVLKDLPIKTPKRPDIRTLKKPLFAASPLARVMQRHTRSLLEIYKENGKLNSNLAKRHVRPLAVISFTAKEKDFYDSLEDYCTELRKQIHSHNEKAKQCMFFYLNFLQLRFASSLHAIKQTLSNRLKKVNNTLLFGAKTFTTEEEFNEALEELINKSDLDDGYDEDDYSSISVDALLKDRSIKDLEWERQRIEKMLTQLETMNSTPSKIQKLLEEIQLRKYGNRVKQLVLFTRFFDTLSSIRKYLWNRESQLRVGIYSGRKVSYYDINKGKDIETSRDKVKQLFLNGEIDILLCTDAAAEGLNLQTADLLINFDMGWNPMKLEQRIGRIDRIGQKHTDIEVLNMCYLGSTEEVVYGRLFSRLSEAGIVVGSQQISMLPVCSEEFRKLQSGELTLDNLTSIAKKRLKKEREQVASMEMTARDIYDIYDKLSKKAKLQALPAEINDIWNAVISSRYLKNKGVLVQEDVLQYSDENGTVTKYTKNRERVTDNVHFLTWGSNFTDVIFADVADKLVEQKWLRKIVVKDECITMVGYVVATDHGIKLITSYSQLEDIKIDTNVVITDDVMEGYRTELLVELGKESKIYSKMCDTLARNADFAKVNSDLVKYSAAGVLQKVTAEEGAVYYLEAFKFIAENERKSYLVNLPMKFFHGKKNNLLFNINDISSNTNVAVNGVLLELAIKCMQRTVDGMKQRKSEITVEEVVRRLVG